MKCALTISIMLFGANANADAGFGDQVTIQSVNYPDHYVVFNNDKGFIKSFTKETPDLFKLTQGLSDSQGYSFESVKKPGFFIAHINWEIKLIKPTAAQKNLATFSQKSGLENGKGSSFEVVNGYPGVFMRHCSFELFVDNNNVNDPRKTAYAKNNSKKCDSRVFNGDASFIINPQTNESIAGVPGFKLGYGTIGGDFKPLKEGKQKNGTAVIQYLGTDQWHGIHNNVGNTDTPMSGGLVFKPKDLVFHPGNTAEHLTKLVYQAGYPTTCNLDISFTNIDQQAKKTWAWVHTNAKSATGTNYFSQGRHPSADWKELFTKGMTGYNSTVRFAGSIKLNKGEKISVEVGNGGDKYFDDSVKVDVTRFDCN
jgi:hypothetical protein